jgi:HEAT repeat protein
MGAVGDVAIERTVKHKGGRDAKEASPAFIAALNDQDEIVRRYAASALKTIKQEPNPLFHT